MVIVVNAVIVLNVSLRTPNTHSMSQRVRQVPAITPHPLCRGNGMGIWGSRPCPLQSKVAGMPSSECKSGTKRRPQMSPVDHTVPPKPLPTLGSSRCQHPNSTMLQAMPGKPATLIGCSGLCEGDRFLQVSLCPGVPATPAPLPGHGHARGDPRASASYPQTQLLGAYGES